MSHTSIKGQILADLMAEFAEAPYESEIKAQHLDGTSVSSITPQVPLCWKVYVDGVANQRGSGVGLVLLSPKKLTIEKSLRLGFSATNNEVEYKAFEGNVHGSKNGGKSSKNVFRLKIGCWLSEGRAKSKR